MKKFLLNMAMGMSLGFVCFFSLADAQELFVAGGANSVGDSTTYGYKAGFSHELLKKSGVIVFYSNEGHHEDGPDSHRDLVAIQAYKDFVLSKEFVLRGSVGPCMLYDTTDRGKKIDHSIAGIGSVWLHYYPRGDNKFYLSATSDYVLANTHKTVSAMIGAGYNFGSDPKSKTHAVPDDSGEKKNELAVYIGQVVPNVKNGPKKTLASSVEYTRKSLEHLHAVASFINEGERQGVSIGPRIAEKFLDGKFSAAMGIAAYLTNTHGIELNGLFSVTAGIRIYKGFELKAMFGRVIARRNGDADLFLLGASYSF